MASIIFLGAVLCGLFPVISVQAVELPCRFYGTVRLDGTVVPDGTTISVIVEDDIYRTNTPTEVYGTSTYAIKIVPPENKGYTEETQIYFRIGEYDATETATWTPGGNINLDLTAISTPALTPTPTPIPTPTLSPTPSPVPTIEPTVAPRPTPVLEPWERRESSISLSNGVAIGLITLLSLLVLLLLYSWLRKPNQSSG